MPSGGTPSAKDTLETYWICSVLFTIKSRTIWDPTLIHHYGGILLTGLDLWCGRFLEMLIGQTRLKRQLSL
jgi:hypothetical protein